MAQCLTFSCQEQLPGVGRCALRDERDRLRDERDRLRDERDRLRDERDRLRDENGRLRDENGRSRAVLASLVRDAMPLRWTSEFLPQMPAWAEALAVITYDEEV